MAVSASSLFDPPYTALLPVAGAWVERLLTGTLATSIAILAIGWVGLLMLRGRLDLRRGAVVILGCFVLFGARTIAEGLYLRGGDAGAFRSAAADPPIAVPPLIVDPPISNRSTYDPYAGAAVPR